MGQKYVTVASFLTSCVIMDWLLWSQGQEFNYISKPWATIPDYCQQDTKICTNKMTPTVALLSVSHMGSNYYFRLKTRINTEQVKVWVCGVHACARILGILQQILLIFLLGLWSSELPGFVSKMQLTLWEFFNGCSACLFWVVCDWPMHRKAQSAR